MTKSNLEKQTDLLAERLSSLRGYIGTSLKKTDPYMQVKKSDDEVISDYLSTDPQVWDSLRQQAPEQMADMESKIQKMMEGKNGR